MSKSNLVQAVTPFFTGSRIYLAAKAAGNIPSTVLDVTPFLSSKFRLLGKDDKPGLNFSYGTGARVSVLFGDADKLEGASFADGEQACVRVATLRLHHRIYRERPVGFVSAQDFVCWDAEAGSKTSSMVKILLYGAEKEDGFHLYSEPYFVFGDDDMVANKYSVPKPEKLKAVTATGEVVRKDAHDRGKGRWTKVGLALLPEAFGAFTLPLIKEDGTQVPGRYRSIAVGDGHEVGGYRIHETDPQELFFVKSDRDNVFKFRLAHGVWLDTDGSVAVENGRPLEQLVVTAGNEIEFSFETARRRPKPDAKVKGKGHRKPGLKDQVDALTALFAEGEARLQALVDAKADSSVIEAAQAALAEVCKRKTEAEQAFGLRKAAFESKDRLLEAHRALSDKLVDGMNEEEAKELQASIAQAKQALDSAQADVSRLAKETGDAIAAAEAASASIPSPAPAAAPEVSEANAV